jgi:pyruvate/2-oxoglutarate dehydrogenase complex dihydrolipoamide acyltransferase (E2) component
MRPSVPPARRRIHAGVTRIVNLPQLAILGVGAIRTVPDVGDDG